MNNILKKTYKILLFIIVFRKPLDNFYGKHPWGEILLCKYFLSILILVNLPVNEDSQMRNQEQSIGWSRGLCICLVTTLYTSKMFRLENHKH